MIFGILNQKGGAGKTTVSINFAVSLIRDGYRTLLIDADPQGSALDWSVARKQTLPDQLVDCVHLPEANLYEHIDQYRDKYDHIIIDGAPRVTDLARSAIIASDIIVMPVQAAAFDIWAAQEIVSLVKEAENLKPLKSCFLLNRTIPRTIIARSVKAALEQHQVPLLHSSLTQRIRFAESALDGRSVYDYSDMRNPAADEIDAVKTELLKMEF